MRLEVLPDASDLARAAADEIALWFKDESRTTIGLAGGSTPRLAYEMLRSRELPWTRVHGWMTDERHVPVGHPDSNAGMARQALLDHVPATLHEVPYCDDAVRAAEQYERVLAGLSIDSAAPDIGLVLLGLGADGHTASLFPGTEAVDEPTRTFVANWVPDHRTWRLTATVPLLRRAARTLFLVSGAPKAPVVAEILEGSSGLPAAVVSAGSPDPVWMIDRAAAGALS